MTRQGEVDRRGSTPSRVRGTRATAPQESKCPVLQRRPRGATVKRSAPPRSSPATSRDSDENPSSRRLGSLPESRDSKGRTAGAVRPVFFARFAPIIFMRSNPY